MWWIEEGDSAQVLKVLPTASIDALVTDPPAGISFMGANWDGSKGGRDKWIAWFAGRSGSTGIAALQEGCHFIGIEQELKYVEIARQRLSHEDNKTADSKKA